jgi:hypothetical protein
MVDSDLVRPTLRGLLTALRLHLAEGFAAWRAARRMRAELRRIERCREKRLRAELASMSPAERLDLDVTGGNAAWTARPSVGA